MLAGGFAHLHRRWERRDPHVNLGFYKDRTREYVSVAGTAVKAHSAHLLSVDKPQPVVLFEPGTRSTVKEKKVTKTKRR